MFGKTLSVILKKIVLRVFHVKLWSMMLPPSINGLKVKKKYYYYMMNTISPKTFINLLHPYSIWKHKIVICIKWWWKYCLSCQNLTKENPIKEPFKTKYQLWWHYYSLYYISFNCTYLTDKFSMFLTYQTSNTHTLLMPCHFDLMFNEKENRINFWVFD